MALGIEKIKQQDSLCGEITTPREPDATLPGYFVVWIK